MIVLGYKPVENRTWKTSYRGDLLIHAALKFDHDGYDWIANNMPDIPLYNIQFPRGGIIGSARVVDCVSECDSPWFSGPIGIMLANARTLPFMPYKGRLGLFPCDYMPYA